jgi:glycosyltransferase involved in cell wall biosynthesis
MSNSYNISILLVYWDNTGPSVLNYFPDKSSFKIFRRSEWTTIELIKLLRSFKPDRIVASGWMDFGYLLTMFYLKNVCNDIKTYCATDDQWHGTLRQRIGSVIYRIFLKKWIYDYMWVAGKPQLYYASKFGVQYSHILTDLLIASPRFRKDASNEKRFIFLGRLVKEKNVQLLLDAHFMLSEVDRKNWKLHIIGDGPLLDELVSQADDNVIFSGSFLGDNLIKELIKGGVGCVTSSHEQWGLVVHEFSSMGMPLILSDRVGAGSEFLVHNLNGFIFDNRSVEDLYLSMKKIINLSELDFKEFSENSKRLSLRVNHKDSIMKFINHKG